MNSLRAHAWPVAAILLSAAAVYGVTLGHQFLLLWDDNLYVTSNVYIRQVSLQNLRTVFTVFLLGNYAPVHLLSYMLDYALWGLDPQGYHAENVLLHAVNGVLLFLLLVRLQVPRLAALFGGLLFVVHPVQVEAVAWVAQRKTLLSMFFFLAAWHCYLGYRRAAARRAAWYAASLAALCLALLSKSAAVVFPFLVLLQDICFPGEEGRRAGIMDKLPYLLVSAIGSVVALASQSPEAGGGRYGYPGGSLLSTVYTMLPVLVSYIGDCLWPSALLPYYMIKTQVSADARVMASMAVCAGLVAMGVMLWRTRRRMFFFYAVFFLALVPVSQIVPLITLKNDRYLYFPMIGFAGFMALVVSAVSTKYPQWRRAVFGLAAAAVLVLSVVSVRQAAVWKDDYSLWSYTVAEDPGNLVGWGMLKDIHIRRGEIEPAFRAGETFRLLKQQAGPVRGLDE